MLPEKEKACVVEFFNDFPSAELFALALLISKRNLQPDSRKDALDIICQHSDHLESILEKKRISKKYLCQYLHKSKISITHSWDKPALIRKLLEFWKNEGKLSSNQDIQNTPQSNSTHEYYDQLTTKFSEWFYSLINDQDLSNLRPEHFFIDAQVKIALHDENSTDVIEANSSVDVTRALRELQSKYRFRFLPNLSPDAMKYQTDVHGQIMLMVGGTLHSLCVSQVVGMFDQMFLLLRDASDNENWKIKNSHIILRSVNNAVKYTSTADAQNMVPIRS